MFALQNYNICLEKKMDNEIKCKIFELIDTGMEALNYIEEYICKNENEKASKGACK